MNIFNISMTNIFAHFIPYVSCEIECLCILECFIILIFSILIKLFGILEIRQR